MAAIATYIFYNADGSEVWSGAPTTGEVRIVFSDTSATIYANGSDTPYAEVTFSTINTGYRVEYGGIEKTYSVGDTYTQLDNDAGIAISIYAIAKEENTSSVLTITYNGNVIATLEKGQTATIPCDGKKMATDIVVSITNSGGNDEIDTSGLYDAEDNLVASWDTLTTVYGMDVEKDYTSSTCNTDKACPHTVLNDNEELLNGVKLIIPNGVTRIGSRAFLTCIGLTTVTIPDGVTSIGSCAFYGCSSLTTVTIPDSVTSFSDHAFAQCSSLTAITIPDGVTSIGDSAFYGCSSLTTVTIPDSVTSFSGYAFHSCSSLTAVTIPDSVTSIGNGEFYGCSSLTTVTIPDSVTSIGNSAFNNCTSISDVYYKGTEAQWSAIDIGDFNKPLTNATIHYNYGKLDLISFTIDSTSYQAEEGMTWGEWDGSEYDTYPNDIWLLVNPDYTSIGFDDVIVAGRDYSYSETGGSN